MREDKQRNGQHKHITHLKAPAGISQKLSLITKVPWWGWLTAKKHNEMYFYLVGKCLPLLGFSLRSDIFRDGKTLQTLIASYIIWILFWKQSAWYSFINWKPRSFKCHSNVKSPDFRVLFAFKSIYYFFKGTIEYIKDSTLLLMLCRYLSGSHKERWNDDSGTFKCIVCFAL